MHFGYIALLDATFSRRGARRTAPEVAAFIHDNQRGATVRAAASPRPSPISDSYRDSLAPALLKKFSAPSKASGSKPSNTVDDDN